MDGGESTAWWVWALLGWVGLSVPCAVVLGRVIARAEQQRHRPAAREERRDRGADQPPFLPQPRPGDDSDDPRAQAG